MTVVASDDFTAYPSLAAMQLVWATSEQGGTFEGGAGGARVVMNDGVPMWYGDNVFTRTFTGLTPGASYTVSAVVSTCTLDGLYYRCGLAAAQSGTLGQQVDMLDGTNQTNVTLTTAPVIASSEGSLFVRLGFYYGAAGSTHPLRSVTFTSMSIDDGVPAPVFHTALPVLGEDWDTIAYTAGVMYIGDELVGLTRGALRFDPGEEWTPLPYDGDFVPVVGVHELTAQRARFIGRFLPVGPRQLGLYLPASTQAVIFDTTTVTPAVPGTTLVAGDYTPDLKVTWPLLDGGTITVTFPYAFWQRYEFQPEDHGELLVPCEILAVPLTATTAPYLISVVEPSS